MLAPLTSFIVPVMVPVNDCAKRIDGHNVKTTQSAVRIRRMAVPPRRWDYRPGRATGGRRSCVGHVRQVGSGPAIRMASSSVGEDGGGVGARQGEAVEVTV